MCSVRTTSGTSTFSQPMPRLAISLLCLLSSILGGQAQSVLTWGDQHNGTYINPVLNADYSDPDVIRVGDKYYMVASDFHFMGMQILESPDMVNWTIVSQVYDRLDEPGWNENRHFGGGSWAPALRYHDGRFWVFFCTYDEGLFMSSATNPRGPWTPLHCLRHIPKWEDPCPFWDDDGQAYLGRSRWRAGPIIVHRMSADGTRLLDDGVTVYEGPIAEGTKFLKRNGWYYLIIPEGGVGEGWQTVLRSRSIYGPYERRVVLEQGMTTVNGPHQGALVDTPQGTWMFFHFQSVSPAGRVVHLQPAYWKDDWPVIGVDQDRNGIGEPVFVWKKPVTGDNPPCLPQTDDEFDGNELFWVGQQQRALRLQWQWNHNPYHDAWSLNEQPGWLTLHALQADMLRNSHNMLTQKTMGYTSEATTLIDVSQLTDGTHAGLLCTGAQFHGLGICCHGNTLSLYSEADGERTIVCEIKRRRLFLRVTVDSRHNQHQFSYSLDGRNYLIASEVFSLKEGGWKGTRVGLYCYNSLGDSGKASFDWFHYRITE